MHNDNLILTPTYQAPLIKSLTSIIQSASFSTPTQTWQSLQILYRILPPECTKDAITKHTEITNVLQTIATKKPKDPIFSDLEIETETEKYLDKENLVFLELVKDSLFEKGYLKADWGAKPLIEKRGKLSVDLSQS